MTIGTTNNRAPTGPAPPLPPAGSAAAPAPGRGRRVPPAPHRLLRSWRPGHGCQRFVNCHNSAGPFCTPHLHGRGRFLSLLSTPAARCSDTQTLLPPPRVQQPPQRLSPRPAPGREGAGQGPTAPPPQCPTQRWGRGSLPPLQAPRAEAGVHLHPNTLRNPGKKR